MNLKRFTSFALAFILCFALAPVNADALASENDAVKNGYYDSSGQWVEGKLQQTLPEGIHSVNKTATPVADNTYEVTLEVVTKQKVESFTKKSATVLVLDTSKSMNDDSRLKTLKNSAAEFITTYAGKKENTGRYLAVVQFSTGTKVVLNWTDVSTEQGKKSAIDSIQALRANEGTNLQAGLKQASSLFKQSTVQEIQKENRNTVVLTDGAPTYYLEKCSGGIFTWTHTHVVIDGVIYDEKGSGSSGSQNIIDLTTKDAKVLKDESKVYTVCYGAQNQTTYKGGPLVSDFLADNIAQSPDTAFIAGKTEDLMKVFEAISESVVSGITGENLTVTDGSAPFVTVSNLPTTIQQDENGFTWKLTNATTTTEGNQTYYTYQLKYTVKLDADNAEFKEENWYPLNGKTEINMPSGEKVKFPIPAAQGTKTRYTVTYTDGVDNEEVFKDKVFENIVTGSKTPDFGEIPVRDGYTFKGWSPQIEDTVTKTVVYNATWDMNLIDLNIAPTITATDKVLTVGDTFDPKADVTASDKEDGDITANLEVVKNEVDTTKAGVYEVTYKVTDSQGASYTTTIQVTVNPKMETLNEAPIITATDKTITVGDTFDPKADVTASDKEDGDITANLEVVKNEVDTTKAGVYEVTYKVTDSQGASYTTTIQVTVNPKMETLNEAPIITATDKTITVGDTFDPKADVTASDKEDGDITANLEVVKNEVDTTKAGVYEVTYKVTDSQGASYTTTIQVTVNPKMETLNEAPIITATDKTITVGDTFDPKADVTASDKEDGDITANLEVVKNEVDTTKAGVYEVTYKVTDSQGASYTTTIQVTVNPKMETLNEAPIITATDKTITVGDTFDPKADVTASDKEDGDITANLEVVKNEVDTTKAGVYEVTYKVTDSQGASYTTTIQVTVNPKMETLNEAPIITATDKTITVGDTFDPKADVTASDKEDGDITANLEVVKNEVDTTKAGVYEVTYKVTDSQGASYTTTIQVTVNPKMETLNEAPIITATDKTITVGDTFDPKADVTASDKEDGDITANLEVVKNEVDTTKAGVYEVTYKVTDSQGASYTKTIKVTVKERKISTPNTDKEKKPNNGGDKINNTGNPKTGDQTNVGLFTSLLVISTLGIAILAVFKKKKALEHK